MSSCPEFRQRANGVQVRRLGDAAVVFDPKNWQTHVLPPAAAVVADLIEDMRLSGPLTADRLNLAIRNDLELDPQSASIQELLRMFAEIGLLEA